MFKDSTASDPAHAYTLKIARQPDMMFPTRAWVMLSITRNTSSFISKAGLFCMMRSKGIKNMLWKLKWLSSLFSKNFIPSCFKLSIAYMATDGFSCTPTSVNRFEICLQSCDHTKCVRVSMLYEATSTSFCKQKTRGCAALRISSAFRFSSSSGPSNSRRATSQRHVTKETIASSLKLTDLLNTRSTLFKSTSSTMFTALFRSSSRISSIFSMRRRRSAFSAIAACEYPNAENTDPFFSFLSEDWSSSRLV